MRGWFGNRDAGRAWISEWVDGRLEPEDEARARELIEATPEFAAEADAVRESRDLVSALPALSAPRSFALDALAANGGVTRPNARLGWMMRGAAASAALCAVIFAGTFLTAPGGRQATEDVAPEGAGGLAAAPAESKSSGTRSALAGAPPQGAPGSGAENRTGADGSISGEPDAGRPETESPSLIRTLALAGTLIFAVAGAALFIRRRLI